jgi:hypothetical protein
MRVSKWLADRNINSKFRASIHGLQYPVNFGNFDDCLSPKYGRLVSVGFMYRVG